jgi:dihydroorotase
MATLSVVADADITIIDPHFEWILDEAQSACKLRKYPFHGWKLRGESIMTIVRGRVVWQQETE